MPFEWAGRDDARHLPGALWVLPEALCPWTGTGTGHFTAPWLCAFALMAAVNTVGHPCVGVWGPTACRAAVHRTREIRMSSCTILLLKSTAEMAK